MTGIVTVSNVPAFVGVDEIESDARWAGPCSECPTCQQDLVQVIMRLDPESLAPGMFLLDAVCVECATLFRLACPTDRLLRELPDAEDEEAPTD